MSSPAVSVIVGHRERTSVLAESIGAFAREAQGEGGEVILVDGSARDDAREAAAPHRGVRIVAGPAGALMPALWSIGIRASQAPAVALTIASMVPRPGWLARALRELHNGGYAAVGGAIENAPRPSLRHWAVYFARYSGYMLPFEAHDAGDLPGDNAVYRRRDLAPAARYVETAFWEPAAHALMTRSGLRLRMDPQLVVDHHPAFRRGEFVVQRFRHGRHHAASQLESASFGSRIAMAARAPLVPMVLYARVARRVFARRRNRARLLLATPPLLVFFSAWALGEKVGALFGAGRDRDETGAVAREAIR